MPAGRPSLVPCPSCARHVRATERVCPFCGAAVPPSFAGYVPRAPAERLSRAALVAFAAVAVAGCSKETATPSDAGSADKQQQQEPTTVPAYGAPAPTPAPSPVDAGLGSLVAQAAVYGGPPAYRDADAPVDNSPTGVVEAGAPDASNPIPNADRVLAGLRPGFRQCYNQGLSSDPAMSGKVVLALKIDPNGGVLAADTLSNSGLSPQVVSCLQRKARNAQFDAPGPKGSTLQVPLTFTSKP